MVMKDMHDAFNWYALQVVDAITRPEINTPARLRDRLTQLRVQCPYRNLVVFFQKLRTLPHPHISMEVAALIWRGKYQDYVIVDDVHEVGTCVSTLASENIWRNVICCHIATWVHTGNTTAVNECNGRLNAVKFYKQLLGTEVPIQQAKSNGRYRSNAPARAPLIGHAEVLAEDAELAAKCIANNIKPFTGKKHVMKAQKQRILTAKEKRMEKMKEKEGARENFPTIVFGESHVTDSD